MRMSLAKVLWVSEGNEPRIREVLDGIEDISLDSAASGQACWQALSAASYCAVVANFPLPDCTADELLAEIRRIDMALPVVIRDAAGTVADAVRLTKAGADDFLGVDFECEVLSRRISAARELRRTREMVALSNAVNKPDTPPWRKLLVGSSSAMEHVFRIIQLVGQRRCTVLISGETGTGKEMVAKAIHAASSRSRLPMVMVNCAALPENLLEAELFGHVKGAFTGAANYRMGRFEQAHGSTIFLDEIAEMPLDLQAK